MTRTVVAIYDEFQTANQAVRELVDNGFPRDNISIIANNAQGEYSYASSKPSTAASTNETVADETGAGAGVGAGIGAAIGGIGGLLIGLGALTIPGIGPVIAAGPLAVALSTLTGAGVGAVAGGVTGGLLGALIGLGIPEEEAEFYAEGVRRGGVLVTVQTEDGSTEQVMSILNRHHPADINERAAQWREQGWTGYDPNAKTQVARPANTSDQVTQAIENNPVSETMSAPINDQRSFLNHPTDQTDFDPESPDYRNHYNASLANTGYPYDYYVPAYRYGYGMASNARYQNSTWNVVETDARQDWEREHPGTWERFRDAIRHSYEDVMYRGPRGDRL